LRFLLDPSQEPHPLRGRTSSRSSGSSKEMVIPGGRVSPRSNFLARSSKRLKKSSVLPVLRVTLVLLIFEPPEFHGAGIILAVIDRFPERTIRDIFFARANRQLQCAAELLQSVLALGWSKASEMRPRA
jgi:hypothetical protein